jgi:fibronectin-binding autotransporter adhesin
LRAATPTLPLDEIEKRDDDETVLFDACAVLLGGLVLNPPAHAQYTTDYQTNIISGVTSNWSGDYNVGNNSNFSDVLLIQNSGVLSNSSGLIGSGGQGSNVVIVSGSGSVWNNSGTVDIGEGSEYNQLIVTNGGAVYSVDGVVGDLHSDYNTVLVTGTGSVWSNFGNIYLGLDEAANNSFTIADGAAVYNNGDFDVDFAMSMGDTVLVTGDGSVLTAGVVDLSGEGDDTITVSNGGMVNSSSLVFEGDGYQEVFVTGKGSVWNSGGIQTMTYFGPALLTISNGGVVNSYAAQLKSDVDVVFVTGSGSTWDIQTSLDIWSVSQMTVSNGGTVILGGVGVINGGYFSLSISSGSVYVAGLLQVDPGTLAFNSGTLATEATSINSGSIFAVGDGVDAATFQLASGGSGIHSFANGLAISSNALLTGCGTIEGSLIVNPGGTVLANCGGTLTFTGIVTNNGTMQALNGSILEAYALVVNNGVIDIRAGTTNFHGGFINNGIVITTNNFPAITAIHVVGSDVEISVKTGNGSTYVFEENTNLTTGSWTPVIEFTGTGGVITFIDPGAATQPQRFYRVGLIPSP